MRTIYVLLTLFLGAIVLAQGAPDVDELVKQLGHEDYAVREQATKQLVELGEKAVPALEAALKSEDLEVRLRAGRALRAIRGDERKKAEEDADGDLDLPGAPGGSRASSVQVQMLPGKVRVTVREKGEDGKETVKEYEGASTEELIKKYPELKKYLGNFRFRVGGSIDPFDMDKFWKDWNRDFDEELKRLHEDTRRSMERYRRWMQMWEEQRRRQLEEWRGGGQAAGPLLGIRVSRPDGVLDAQLELRGRGLVVDAIEKGSAAESLGLQRFDILLRLDGQEVRRADDIVAIMRKHRESEPLTAVVVRRTKRIELSTSR